MLIYNDDNDDDDDHDFDDDDDRSIGKINSRYIDVIAL